MGAVCFLKQGSHRRISVQMKDLFRHFLEEGDLTQP